MESKTGRHVQAVFACAIACIVSLAAARPAAAQAVYQYQGNPFTFFSCGPTATNDADMGCSNSPAPVNPYTSYLATDRVTATLTLDSPLGPNLAYQDIKARPGFQLTMNDGRHTVTNADALGGSIVEVSTDSGGRILNWRFVLNTGGIQNGGISTIDFTDAQGPHVHDMGTLTCCTPTILGNFAENFGIPGTWNGGVPTPATLTTDLINIVSNPLLGLTNGQISSFTDKLTNVLASIQAGLNKQAINQLQSFINSVQSAQKVGKISAAAAATLINSANGIIAALSQP